MDNSISFFAMKLYRFNFEEKINNSRDIYRKDEQKGRFVQKI